MLLIFNVLVPNNAAKLRIIIKSKVYFDDYIICLDEKGTRLDKPCPHYQIMYMIEQPLLV